MTTEIKTMLIVILVSIVILVGGAWIYEKTSPSAEPETLTAHQDALVHDNSFKIPAAKQQKVTVVEFGDFQCPACGYIEPQVEQFRKEYADNVTFVFRNFPLTTIHKNALKAAQMSYIANEQGKYWEMHDKLYATQQDWEDVADPSDMFISYAAALGMNTDGMKAKLESNTYVDQINADVADGNTLGVDSTPTFFVGNTIIRTASADLLKRAIDTQLQAAK
jgi:protein-disulfide isomerase